MWFPVIKTVISLVSGGPENTILSGHLTVFVVCIHNFICLHVIGFPMSNRLFAASGVEHGAWQHHQEQFRFRRVAFYSQLKSKVGNILAKATALSTNLNIDVVPFASHAHTKPSHSPLPRTNLSPPIHFPLLRCPLPPLHLVCARIHHPWWWLSHKKVQKMHNSKFELIDALHTIIITVG